MDGAQTTKPIQIVDSQNNEVFSIDTDGTIFPAPPSFSLQQTLVDMNNGKRVLFYETASESASVSVTSSSNIDQYEVLAEWEIDFTTTEMDSTAGFLPYVQVSSGALSGFTKVDDLSFGTIKFAYNTNANGWSVLLNIGDDVPNTWVAQIGVTTGASMCFRADLVPIDSCTLKLVYGNSDQAGVNPTFLEIKEVKLYMEIILPYGATLTRVT